MNNKLKGLFWFCQDLRVEDNYALLHAVEESESLHCFYSFNPKLLQPKNFNITSISDRRINFTIETVADLKEQLTEIGLNFSAYYDCPFRVIEQFIKAHQINVIYRSKNNSYYENYIWQKLQNRHPSVKFAQIDSDTLFDENELPFAVDELPSSFSQFRKQVEDIDINIKNCTFYKIPDNYKQSYWDPSIDSLSSSPKRLESTFIGGTTAGKKHLSSYFNSNSPSSYKNNRNQLDGWNNSTKFSPWLANGSLSVRTTALNLKRYESEVEFNDSTYWIGFELLWREYFHWYSKKHAGKLFSFKGIKGKSSHACFYPERYQMWINGNTPFPIVNACMQQLNATGYMSNRGRQIVASCFINELQLDWRYGAAYFEKQLIDYDVAVNWGNWQYLAGVGADPRAKRHFNLDKQTQQFDPNGNFISKWLGDSINKTPKQLDSYDMVDWPI